ncbi:hypothetical protein MKW94_021279 [Papaver nudicaule]|uniref:Small acidic protein 1 n=1 Tax=Papaver nudicaule TaxID=74823 RepID=A0AA41V7T3_PAPNU|nr:hypothetical protein [Papaver nudicaule]MCL7033966.1 hypothetical protein [Papaver nudicaule]
MSNSPSRRERLSAILRKEREKMKPSPAFFYSDDMDDEQNVAMMDVDDADPLDMLGEGVVGHIEHKLVDSDFFNKFSDDFDDSDIN